MARKGRMNTGIINNSKCVITKTIYSTSFRHCHAFDHKIYLLLVLVEQWHWEYPLSGRRRERCQKIRYTAAEALQSEKYRMGKAIRRIKLICTKRMHIWKRRTVQHYYRPTTRLAYSCSRHTIFIITVVIYRHFGWAVKISYRYFVLIHLLFNPYQCISSHHLLPTLA